MAKKKVDKSKCVVIADIKEGVSFIQKQYDKEGKLYAYDIFLPNMTMVSLNVVDAHEFFSMFFYDETDWKEHIDELHSELEKLKDKCDDCSDDEN